MSKTVNTIQTALRTINGPDKTLPRVAVHRAVISNTGSSKGKKGNDGVQTSKLSSSNGGHPTPVNKGTTIKDLAGKNTSGNCETTEKKKKDETVQTIRTAFRPINGSDKKTKTLSNVTVHRAVISKTGSGRYVTENTNKGKDGGVQTSKFSSSKGWTMGPPTPVNKGTTIKDLEKSAGKGKPYCLVNLPGTSGNCETTEKKVMVKHSKDRNALK
ncbi:hypothetical protein RhiirA5_379757 [Rhizophagus irregularis]|nr:hypothetical protein RhiirA5_462746 [Rhizophagus irregularis]PKC03963.1 hypothetical protein RhiirA5_379757 [Rhizophagus irregularis]PKY28772.1 hypothetical protein RhiirB3_445119 [Rhizophagus irregularis]